MDGGNIVLINKEEYNKLKELEDFKDKYEIECTKNKDLESEVERLNKLLQEEKDNKIHTIQFETYLALKNPNFYHPDHFWEDKWIDKKHDVVDSFQFAVDGDFVGYEREFIFDSLEKVGEKVKSDILEKVDEKYNESIKKHMMNYTEVKDNYYELKRKIDEFNESHLFHKIKI